MVDGMLRRIAERSVRYAGELVVTRASSSSSATSSILRQPVSILSAEFCARRLQLVSLTDGVETGMQ